MFEPRIAEMVSGIKGRLPVTPVDSELPRDGDGAQRLPEVSFEGW